MRARQSSGRSLARHGGAGNAFGRAGSAPKTPTQSATRSSLLVLGSSPATEGGGGPIQVAAASAMAAMSLILAHSAIEYRLSMPQGRSGECAKTHTGPSPDISGLEQETEARGDQQEVHRAGELAVVQPLEARHAARRAEQHGWHVDDSREVEGPPSGAQARQRQDGERRQLHDQDERLVDAALALLAKTLEAAPDGDEGAGECRRAAGDAAQEARQPVEQRMLPPHDDRPAEDHEGGVEYEQRADDVDVEYGPAMQQAIDAERQPDA